MQKIDKILVVTHNKGKFIEISDLLPKKIKKISPVDLGIKSPIENGKTFEDNSEIKAEFFCKNSNLVTLSDDSGLEIECLNGEPGIFSARWAKKFGSFNNAMIEILSKVEKINNDISSISILSPTPACFNISTVPLSRTPALILDTTWLLVCFSKAMVSIP